MATVQNPVADAKEFLAAWAASARTEPTPKAPKVTRTRCAVLLAAAKAGRATAATLAVTHPDGYEAEVVVYAFAKAAQERLLALATNADRWETGLRITTTTNAKGYSVVKSAADVELFALAYRPRPVPTLRQHLGAYLSALGQRLSA